MKTPSAAFTTTLVCAMACLSADAQSQDPYGDYNDYGGGGDDYGDYGGQDDNLYNDFAARQTDAPGAAGYVLQKTREGTH